MWGGSLKQIDEKSRKTHKRQKNKDRSKGYGRKKRKRIQRRIKTTHETMEGRIVHIWKLRGMGGGQAVYRCLTQAEENWKTDRWWWWWWWCTYKHMHTCIYIDTCIFIHTCMHAWWWRWVKEKRGVLTISSEACCGEMWWMTRVIREICCCSPPQLVSFGDKQTDRTVWCSDESHEKEKHRAGGDSNRTIESFVRSFIHRLEK